MVLMQLVVGLHWRTLLVRFSKLGREKVKYRKGKGHAHKPEEWVGGADSVAS